MIGPDVRGAQPGTALPRVLIADDDVLVREVPTVYLQDGFRVVAAAEDAEAAVAAAAEHRPDIAVVDVQMPAGGGRRAVEGIRREAPDTAIVVLSADESEQDVRDFMRAGAMTYIRKGIDPQQLARALRDALQAQARATAGRAARGR